METPEKLEKGFISYLNNFTPFSNVSNTQIYHQKSNKHEEDGLPHILPHQYLYHFCQF